VLKHIVSLLTAWAVRTGNGARIARNLAVRWLPDHPTTGIDPDVAVLLPGPADFDDLSSYRLWEPGRVPPPFAVEVVSASHPYKDYALVHEGYAEMGVAELLVFDPLLVGPPALGGPVSLQLWQRDVSGVLDRVHFGNQPVYSRVLDAWLSVSGRQLEISNDRGGTQRWPTLEQAAAAEAQSALARVSAELESERTKREALEQRLRDLEAIPQVNR
jgi:Uma2 family endonuclease